jgi:UDP-N-acetylglucosamine transferase subunit ALG13
MIFITIGTHDQEFTRLIKKIDELAPNLKEKIVIQKGYTRYLPKNCESFEFASTLEPYFKKARLIIAHAGIGNTLEAIRKFKKPLILVPRQHKYREHINDHQVGMARHFEEKWGVKVIYDIKELNLDLLKNYKKKVKMHDEDLNNFREVMKKIILSVKKEKEGKIKNACSLVRKNE